MDLLPKLHRATGDFGVMRWLLVVATLLLSGPAYAQTGPSSAFDVTKFGAKPSDGVSDTDAIQDAFDAAAASSPATVIFPRGTYTMTDKVTISDSEDITIEADGAIIQATVRICPWWFGWDECTNIQWRGGKFVGVAAASTIYDTFVAEESVDQTVTAISTAEVITTDNDHGRVVGDTVTFSGTNSTPVLSGTYTVSALDSINPLRKFTITGVDVTGAGTAGTLTGYGALSITGVTTGEVVTVSSTANLTDGGTYYISGTSCTPPIDGLRSIDVLNATTFTLLDTAECDTEDVTVAQVGTAGEIRHGVDSTYGDDTVASNPTRLADEEISKVFRFTRGSGHVLQNITTEATEGLLFSDRSNKWLVENTHHTGPFPLGWAHGIRPNFNNNHKQVALTTHTIQCDGGYDCVVRDMWTTGAAGSYVQGAGNPEISVESDRIAAFAQLYNVNTFEFFDNAIYLGSGRQCKVIGGIARGGIGSGTAVKAKGYGHLIQGVLAEDISSGFAIEGTLARTTIDDPWGAGSAGITYVNCTARNCSDQAFWTDDNKDMWPRDVRIIDCNIINCGMVAQTLATDNLPAVNKYGDFTSLPSAINRVPVKLMNIDRLEFVGNTIDESEGGVIISSQTSSDGFVIFEVPEQLALTRRMGLRTFITVSGHSVSGYNGTHFVTALLGDPTNPPDDGNSDTKMSRFLKTDTTYTSAGTGGLWTHPKNDYEVYVGLNGGASNGAKPSTSLIIRNNTVIGAKNGFYLTDVTDAQIVGNRGVALDGGNPSALFKVANLRRSTISDNRMMPLGGRLVSVDSGGIYSGITASDNEGAIYTSEASTSFLPLDNSVLYLESDRVVDVSNATSGDETVLLADQDIGGNSNYDNRYGDTYITAETSADAHTCAAWLDRLTHARCFNDTHTKRPTLEMGATYSSGSDADLLNSHSVMRFDGTDDLLYIPSEVSLASTGTIYVVAKRRSDVAGTQVLLSSSDEATQNTYFRLEENVGSNDVRLRIRNGGSDTETLVHSDTTAVNVDAWKIIRVASDGANISMAISNGAGAMTSQTVTVSGTDGRWFDDVGSGASALPRDGFYIGAEKRDTGGGSTEMTHGAFDIAAILIFNGDVTANYSAIQTYLFAQYGAL